jgi:hypothetical protein
MEDSTPAGTPPGKGSRIVVQGNEHAMIYAFTSPDGLTWSPANGGNPVIKVPVDPGCYTCYTGIPEEFAGIPAAYK